MCFPFSASLQFVRAAYRAYVLVVKAFLGAQKAIPCAKVKVARDCDVRSFVIEVRVSERWVAGYPISKALEGLVCQPIV